MSEAQAKSQAEFEAELTARDERIKELTCERDEERDLVARMREHVQDADAVIESWVEAFNMTLNDKGDWCFEDGLMQLHEELGEKYRALLKRWNNFVPEYNAIVAPRRRNLGRPIAASDAQQEEVLKRHKAGESLRWIAEAMTLSRRTVDTIIRKGAGTDRATMRRLERIAPEKFAEASARARKRTRDALPKRINTLLSAGRDLLKEANALPAAR